MGGTSSKAKQQQGTVKTHRKQHVSAFVGGGKTFSSACGEPPSPESRSINSYISAGPSVQ